jgi:hypothetical protein
MPYIPISQRNLKMLNVTFLAKNIKISQLVREDRVERFRIDMLYKYDFNGKKTQHLIKIDY